MISCKTSFLSVSIKFQQISFIPSCLLFVRSLPPQLQLSAMILAALLHLIQSHNQRTESKSLFQLMSLSQIKSTELQKDSFLLSKFQSVGVMKCFSYFWVIIVSRIIGSDKIWSDCLKRIKVSKSTWRTGT